MASDTTTPTMTMAVAVRLAPSGDVTREELEDAAMEVEEVLDEHALGLTHGASASANFADGTIEIDMRLTGRSTSEVYQTVALIMTQLDQYCSLNIATPPSDMDRARMTVQSSAMELVPA